MSYYFTKIVERSFDDTRTFVEEQLKLYGFGIVSEIDMDTKFKEKLNKDFRPYKILGACSPKHAYMAVNAEKYIGLMLPCNITLQEVSASETEVSVIDPVASMQAVDNPDLAPVALEIRAKLEEFITGL